MIKFRCACEKKIGVPVAYAGKTIKCPGCGAATVVPQPPVEPATEVAKVVTPVEDTEGRSTIWSDDLLAQNQPAPEVEKMTCPQCGRQVLATRSVCPGCKYSFVPDVSQFAARDAVRAAKSGPSFFKDALRALTPVRSGGEMITLVIAMVLFLLPTVLGAVPIYGIYGSLIIQGYFCVYMFHIMLETANGETRLPDLPFSEMAEIRAAFTKLVISYLYACLPACLIVFGCLSLLGKPAEEDAMKALITRSMQIGTLAGLFFWPMIALSIALGDTLLVRPGKIVMSIIRTLPTYILCCVMMYLAIYLNFVAVGQIASLMADEENRWILNILFDLGGLLAMICTMRIIGVYFLHNRGKIDW